jgi:two-component system sensor histidine kinase PhoQ
MQEIISRQLRRAAGQSRALLAPPVSMREPLDAIIRSLQKVYVDKGLEFRIEMEADPEVRIDHADLYEILGNLLDNACKWAHQQIAVTAIEKDGFVEVSISDDGPGFPDDAARMLERGLRADSRQEGQGLGLAVVREIVTTAGGSIEITDSNGKGGSVRLTLPA